MHKTGACLPKQRQAGPLVQALVLDLGLPPEQLLAPAQRTYSPSARLQSIECNEHVCHDYAGFNNIMLTKEIRQEVT